VERSHAAVPCGVFVANSSAAVGRAIVNEDDLYVRERLGKDAVHAAVQVLLRLIDGDNDGDGGRDGSGLAHLLEGSRFH